ncbi:MAG: hypothetical protein HY913_21510 [Desulfomonile tiedjei]|nr:hypothetical protein [Desulfomonile tiedjei]
MNQKPKTATTVFYPKKIIMECPFCGMTLIKTDYLRIRKLLEETDLPIGKVCSKCGGVAVIRLNTRAREILLTRLEEQGISPDAKSAG